MIKLNNKVKTNNLKTDKFEFNILNTGDVYNIVDNDIQINLFKGNLLDGAISNIYLRKNSDQGYEYAPLLGIKSNSKFEIINNEVVYQGKALNVKYQVTLKLNDDTWYYNVLLDKTNEEFEYELFYIQDVAVAPNGMIQSSEAYTGQYVDNRVFNNFNNTLLFRQNQGENNLVQIGSFYNVESYSSDGFQFFGKEYKVNNVIKGLESENLANEIYQYEFPLAALKTFKFKLDETKNITFYGKYVRNKSEIIEEPLKVEEINFSNEFLNLTNLTKLTNKVNIGEPIVGKEIEDEKILENYNNVRHVEKENGKLYSFFAEEGRHVVTKRKEEIVERPHGQVMIHGDILNASKNVMASTGHMFGVFSSHVVLGNTNFHKLTGDVRNKLNLQKISGQRIYIENDNKYHILQVPSYFEMATNNFKWVYHLEDDVIVVEYLSNINHLGQKLEFKSMSNKKYNLLVTQQVIMGDVENKEEIDFKLNDKGVTIYPTKNQFIMDHYDTLKYEYESKQDVEILDDSYFFGEEAHEGMLIFKYTNVSEVDLFVYATFEEEFDKNINFNKEEVNKVSYDFFKTLIPFNIETNDKYINKFNDLSLWYTQNALVHYSSPHGLEQFNGAAWGTRDVCQGPFELFMTAQKYDIARNIILRTFERQFKDSGDFPQWFMFDNYFRVQPHDSHGDIIVWPMRALAQYLEVTKDYSILEEKVSYMDLKENNFTKEKYSLVHHIEKTIECIKNSEIEDVNLPSYGGGDWNDTLQPANQELTKKMVSTWTVSLLYDTLDKLSNTLPKEYNETNEEVKEYKEVLKENYFKYLVKDNIPSGFAIFEEDAIRYLIHPTDNVTNLNYRLLSFKQGIIGEMYDEKTLEEYIQILDKHLRHPDGYRLMDKAIPYHGGKNTYFQRAETASNFGREVGIHYIHAHIRYIEAMAKAGKGDKALEGLLAINPINIKDSVPNALERQSNTYFSSSDGNFLNRYDAVENFDKLRTGEIGVKAGWRLYSSGPGIYLNQLISNTLGVKVFDNKLLIDPAVSKDFNGSTLTYKYKDKKVTIKYNLSDSYKVELNGKDVTNDKFVNKYKVNATLIDDELINNLEEINITYNYKA